MRQVEVMRFLKMFFNADLFATLIGAGVSGAIVYAITGWGFWGCAFSGYLITELMSIANKVTTITDELKINNYKLSELQKQNSQLSDQIWDVQQKIDDARVADRKIFSAHE